MARNNSNVIRVRGSLATYLSAVLLAVCLLPPARALSCSSFDEQPADCKGCVSGGKCTYNTTTSKCTAVQDKEACPGELGITMVPSTPVISTPLSAFSTDDECPETVQEKPDVRNNEHCGFMFDKDTPTCCPEAAENQAANAFTPGGTLTFLFKDECLNSFRQLLCAQTCHGNMKKFVTVGEPIKEKLPKYAGFVPDENGLVANLTFNVCESFCDQLYGACKDSQLIGGQTVQQQYSRDSFCAYLGSDEAVKSGFVQYTLAPLGNYPDSTAIKVKGPYQAYKMVSTSNCKAQPCWTPVTTDTACGADSVGSTTTTGAPAPAPAAATTKAPAETATTTKAKTSAASTKASDIAAAVLVGIGAGLAALMGV